MVARISFSKRVQDALAYNEQKVARGVADLVGAHGYLRRVQELTFRHKLEGLQLRNSLNDRARTNTIHVSLNFSPRDKALNKADLQNIAQAYMEGIGFKDQPYLVYQHRDAGHPHLHIVSTTIRRDGSRIPTHNLGRNGSTQVRKAIEKTFGLVPAKDRVLKESAPSLLAPQQAVYGREETRRQVASVVGYVFYQYAYSSLLEYNAALRQFGVAAARGSAGSRTHRYGGLVYRIVDERGSSKGVPVKASSLPGKPTLAALEHRFSLAEKHKELAKPLLLSKIDRAAERSRNLMQFTKALQDSSVAVQFLRTATGKYDGLTFVDTTSRTVFTGGELEMHYSAAGLMARLCQGKMKNPVSKVLGRGGANEIKKAAHDGVTLAANLKSLEELTHASLYGQEAAPPAAFPNRRRRKPGKNLNL